MPHRAPLEPHRAPIGTGKGKKGRARQDAPWALLPGHAPRAWRSAPRPRDRARSDPAPGIEAQPGRPRSCLRRGATACRNAPTRPGDRRQGARRHRGDPRRPRQEQRGLAGRAVAPVLHLVSDAPPRPGRAARSPARPGAGPRDARPPWAGSPYPSPPRSGLRSPRLAPG